MRSRPTGHAVRTCADPRRATDGLPQFANTVRYRIEFPV
jgi:hypothetical protein